jgi:hypothetical protein
MGNNISIIIGTTIGITIFVILFIMIIIYCCKRIHRRQFQSRENDSLQSVITNKHVRSISFVSNDYHNNMTLLASPRRLAMLELQQQEEEEEEFSYENSSFDFNELFDTKTMRF